MESLLQDVRYGLRLLVKNPTYSIIAVITLALGIGANTVIFSVVYGVLLKPLPYQHPEQLVKIYSDFPHLPGGGLRHFWLSPPEYLDLKRDAQSWQSLDGWVNAGTNLTGGTQPIRVTMSNVTGGLFQSIGVSPLIGRVIAPFDDLPGAQRVTLISQGLWNRAFGGDKNVLGRDTELDGVKYTIIGVMPQGFEFPPGEIDTPEMWVPLQIDPANPGRRGNHFLSILGRLKPGVNISQARGEMSRLVQHYGQTSGPNTHAFSPDNHPIIMFPLQAEVVSNIRSALLMLSGAVLFVLLIACVNVANLLLARAEVRQREIALRAALGASTGRLARQFIVEGTVLALIGAIAGLSLAYGGLRLMVITNAGLVPRVGEISLNSKALLFTLATSLFTGIFFGLAPLIHIRSHNIIDPLKVAAGRSTASATSQTFRRVLVCGEVALAMVLLVGSGLMVRAFWKLLQVNPGFSSQGVMTMRVALSDTSYHDNQSLISFWSRLHEQLSNLPGVESAALVSGLPPLRQINANDTDIEGLPKGPDAPIQNVDYWETVTPSYFDTMRIQLIEGRFLDKRDGDGAPPTVVINQAMARHFYGNQSPLGRRISPGGGQGAVIRTIVGVVADVKNAGLDQPAGTELFIPYAQNASSGFGLGDFYVMLRTSGDPTSVVRSASGVIHKIDPGLPIASVQAMDDIVGAAQSRPRFLTLLLGLFSVLALSLAAVGIYGVMSYSVTQRTQEIGIRMALGAKSTDVLGMVMKNGLLLTVIGIVVGLVGAIGLTKFMSTLLFGVTTTDPVTFFGVPVLLALVALGACYIPARRATRVDPMIALRHE